MNDFPHRRYNTLTQEWVLVSPHRAKRPWLGQVEKQAPEQIPAYDPACYLCPRNERAGGVFLDDKTIQDALEHTVGEKWKTGK